MLRTKLLVMLSVAVLLPVAKPSFATNSKPELERAMRDLLDWLPGEYDTLPQVDLERRLGAPPDGEHERQFRMFVRANVPQIGSNVIYGEIHVGGKTGPIVPGQQVMYIVSLDEKRAAVKISGRRIKDGDQYRYADWTPEKLKTIALDPDFGGNCDFLWRRHGRQLVGKLTNVDANNNTCTMVSKRSGNTMLWDAEWILNDSELWVFDNGYLLDPKEPDKPGRFFSGREDRTHERLYKARTFGCKISGAAVSQSFALYDRGGEKTLQTNQGAPLTLRLLRAQYPTTAGTDLEEQLSLMLMPVALAGGTEAAAVARQGVRGDALRISLQYQGINASCDESKHIPMTREMTPASR